MLSREETDKHLLLAKNGNEESKSLLISENMPLIKSVIKRYVGKNCEYDDLFQLGSMGLLKAINNFDLSLNLRFSTYAVPMIAGEVKRFLRDDGSIKVSRSVKAQYIEIKKFIESFKSKNEKSPTIEQIASNVNLSPEDVIFAIESNKMPVSIYEKTQNKSGEKNTFVMDKIKSEESEDKTLIKIALKKILNELSPREKKIILLRFFRDKTQSEVAEILQVSQVQVSRLENKLLLKLKERLK